MVTLSLLRPLFHRNNATGKKSSSCFDLIALDPTMMDFEKASQHPVHAIIIYVNDVTIRVQNN